MGRIKLAKNAGFCMGVRRAVDMALEATMKKTGPIYTYGPLIHNPQVLEILKGKGVQALNEDVFIKRISDPERKYEGTVIIRAHGVSPQVRHRIKETGFAILDATCPHVSKVQAIIKRYANQGYATVIVGEKDHAEVVGLLGYAQDNGYVVNTLEEVASLPPLEKVILVAQTTQDCRQFEKIAEQILNRFPPAKVFNTICDSTHRRQNEVSAMTQKVEVMVVVGGKESGNTRRLAQISRATGIPTFQVETEKELDLKELCRYSAVGITAGASTPNWLILKIAEQLRRKREKGGVGHFLESVARIAAASYILLALGAGSLTYTCAVIEGLKPNFSFILVATFYVFSMHVLNRLTDKASEKYNQPGRMEFYEHYGPFMIAAGISSAAVALALAWFQGIFPFLFLLAISGMGMLYNIRVFPNQPGRGIRYQKLKDIPGSKTLFVSLAWGVVTSLLPTLAEGGRLLTGTAAAFLFSSILVYVRSTLYDFKDIHGDLLVGKETIPIVLGKRKSEILVVGLLIFLGGVLILSGPLQWASPVTPFLTISLGYIVFYYWLYRRRVLGGGLLFEGVVDGSLIFPSFLAYIGTAFVK
jgi:(E)-4-hydroxy-3-methyl-but-2-enyl pyrophosphate reductase